MKNADVPKRFLQLNKKMNNLAKNRFGLAFGDDRGVAFRSFNARAGLLRLKPLPTQV